MRSFGFAWVLTAIVLLYGCPRRISDVDAAEDVDAFYDPGTGNGFTGDIVFDDSRVMGLDASMLRAGSSQCRIPILARVTRIVDGDTMHVEGVSESLPDADVRFIGVNAPEIAHMVGDPVECFGNEAAAFTRQLLGHLVWLTFDADCMDPYDRLLAYVHIGSGSGDMWQRQLVRRGFAYAADFRPNSTYASVLAADQVAADSENTGLWAACP